MNRITIVLAVQLLINATQHKASKGRCAQNVDELVNCHHLNMSEFFFFFELLLPVYTLDFSVYCTFIKSEATQRSIRCQRIFTSPLPRENSLLTCCSLRTVVQPDNHSEPYYFKISFLLYCSFP